MSQRNFGLQCTVQHRDHGRPQSHRPRQKNPWSKPPQWEKRQTKKTKSQKRKEFVPRKGGTRKGGDLTYEKSEGQADVFMTPPLLSCLASPKQWIFLTFVISLFPPPFFLFFTGLLFVFIFWESVAHARGGNKTDRSKKTGRSKRTFVSQYFPVTFSLPARQPLGCYVETPL